MKHDELLTIIDDLAVHNAGYGAISEALRAVVELHKVLLVKNYENDTDWYECQECTRGISPSISYPCPTIQVIQKELL